MHELAITQSMLDLVLEQARKVEAREVKRINLVIGEMSGFVEECVQFYFDFISKGTIAEQASLSFKLIPTTARCRSCGRLFELREFDWTCPYCQGNSMEIISGKELFVESIEVE
jgi:hydrogenase nickel incorporation protein HypA/HybF